MAKTDHAYEIYRIDAALEALIDPETGEILDLDAFAELQLGRSELAEQIALLYKNAAAEAAAIKAEEKNLTERRRAAEARAERHRAQLEDALGGDRLSTARVEVRYIKSTAVEVTDEGDTLNWALIEARDDLYKVETILSKSAIKDALKRGEAIPGAALVERQNIQIK